MKANRTRWCESIPMFGTLLIILALGGPVWAQESTVLRGTVTDDAGQPIPVVSVTIEGTQVSTLTNPDGQYELTLPPSLAQGQDVTVRAQLIGRRVESATVSLEPGQTVIQDFTLAADPLRMEGITVAALGMERQARSLGSATTQLAGSDLTRVEPNLVNTLSGKVAGVHITNSGPQGASSRMVIRGENSLTGDNQPLFIVDGIPVDNSIGGATGMLSDQGGFDYGNPIQDINPADIQSLTVLKGPNAAALYGSRAANGAVIIETKKGENAPGGEIVVSQQVTFEDELRLPEYQNEYGQGYSGQFSYYDGYGGGVFDDYDTSWGPPLDQGLEIPQWNSPYDPATDSREPLPWVSSPNNIDNFFDVGVTSTTNVSVSASTEMVHGRASVGRMHLNGMAPGHAQERISLAFAGGVQASNRLGIDASAQYITSDGDNRPGVGYGTDNFMNGFIWFGRQVDTNMLEDLYQDVRPEGDPIEGVPYNWNTSFHQNPYFIQNEHINTDTRDRLLGQVSATYQLNSWLSAMARIGTDWYQDERAKTYSYNRQLEYAGFYTTSPINGNREYVDINGSFANWDIGSQETNADFLLTASPDLLGPFTTTWLFGGNRRDYERENDYTWTGVLATPGTYDVSNAASPPDRTTSLSRKRVNSLYGQADFGYNNYLFLTVTGRNDWSSTLPEENRSYFYPSVSGSFVFSDLLQPLRDGLLPYAKLRASWARVGNDTDPYSLRNTFVADEIWDGLPSFSVPGQLANPTLLPETTESFEVGAELAFLDNRLGVDVTYYVEETRDQIMPVQLSTSTGYASRLVNAGTVENKGWEVLLRGTPYTSGDFTWETTFTWSKNESKVVELAEGVEGLELGLGDFWGVTLFAREGEPLGQLVGSAYQRDPDGSIIVSTTGGYPLWTTTPQVIGNVNPDWRAGLANEFTYKRARLNVLFDVKQGGDVYSVTNMFGRYSGVLEETAAGRCTPAGNLGPGQEPPPGYPICTPETGIVVDGVNRIVEGNDTTYVPNETVIDAQTFWEANYSVHENNIVDGSYVKLREVTFSYALPPTWTNWMGISALDVSVVGRNLFLWTDAQHIDPETSMEATNVQGFEYGQMPSARSIGVNFTVRP